MKSDLFNLQNVGPATYQDLKLLNIHCINDLINADADDLFIQLQQITETKHDPCVWDVFAAIINEAKAGVKQPWWHWTKIRKERQDSGRFIDSNYLMDNSKSGNLK